MYPDRKKHSRTNRSSRRGAPLFFCTPAQASALLAEHRQPVFLVRHGLTDWNLQMRLQGREDIPLNAEGHKQAQSCAGLLRDALFQQMPLKGVYTSPLSRAQDTAAYISEALELDSPQSIPALIERDYGKLSGLTLAKKKALYPTPVDYPTDIESIPDAALRMKQAIGELCALEGCGAVIAVTHGGVMNALFSCITGGRAGVGANITVNCTVAVVAVGRNDIIPLAFNLCPATFPEYVQQIDVSHSF